ncbi:type II toxin-antitoxin system PemK/MazF family toxin [Staphylococcus delphini]|uniref:type II toxin-antitoxin system PemK/MazF family toxin n=1 Tax=Staphylococcus delphini TaxID=53344 RepID=UPI0012D30B83|nr:type II toxin-antitoxin system PemK/MazF family toxin [Staphylococcus delphini]MTV20920.1 type II toxin-antitoxin system PemK/MazF family toxin [Staphylococcus delphini]MTV23052.1 type II toxin-antitoxin system PemK/MazF family toxin [Staphylococcus delphini]
MELNNEKVYQSFLNTTKKLIDIYKNSNIDNRKIKYLPEWLEFYTRQLLEENKNKYKLYSTYKRGTIVYVNLGSNIGNEFSGNHFCVVMDKKDNPKKSTITVVPLSSKKSKHYTQLTSSIFDITIDKLDKKGIQLIEEADKIEDFANLIMDKHEDYIKSKAERSALLLKYGYLTETYVEKEYKEIEALIKEEAEIFENKISEMKKRAKNINLVRKVFDRHKNKRSYANVSAITTISKKRIQKINNEDPTGEIKISDEDLKQIEKQIIIRFVKS